MKLLRGNVYKKEKGDSIVAGAFMLVLTIICMYFFITLLLNYYTTVKVMGEVKEVARTYMLKMELVGSLDQDDIDEMTAQLEKIGVKNIKLEGNFDSSILNSAKITNYREVGYAGEVNLLIEGEYSERENNVTLMGAIFDLSKPSVQIKIQKKGVVIR